jgi:heat shock protein HslJ
MDVNEYYFMASGVSPDWALDIGTNGIHLRTGEDSYSTPHTIPDKAMDSNVKRYVLRTESAHLNIKIIQEPCQSANEKYGRYSVHVEYKRTTEPEYSVLKGCGAYIMEYRLHDIWALESLNGQRITVSEGLKRPYFEIDSQNASFMGSASCNQMRGSLFFEPGLLRFNDIRTTRKMCPGMLEAEFLKTLQSTIHYKMGDGRLTLTNPNGAELVFRKVD